MILMLLQELGKEKAYISETLFTTIFISFALVRIPPSLSLPQFSQGPPSFNIWKKVALMIGYILPSYGITIHKDGILLRISISFFVELWLVHACLCQVIWHWCFLEVKVLNWYSINMYFCCGFVRFEKLHMKFF